MKYKKNNIDIRKFKTDRVDCCPCCGRKSFSEPLRGYGTRETVNGEKYTLHHCKLCDVEYMLKEGTRVDDYIHANTENYCDFDCENCRYYECIRTYEECYEHSYYLEELDLTDREYVEQLRAGKIKPFIRGRKND